MDSFVTADDLPREFLEQFGNPDTITELLISAKAGEQVVVTVRHAMRVGDTHALVNTLSRYKLVKD